MAMIQGGLVIEWWEQGRGLAFLELVDTKRELTVNGLRAGYWLVEENVAGKRRQLLK